ncbi:mechanosensitive ion channel domain-containing protein [Nibricoccus aquaticus]|nr:mechanosensitive ion channel domain-containing protein [Nibricoccus aquaticus]
MPNFFLTRLMFVTLVLGSFLSAISSLAASAPALPLTATTPAASQSEPKDVLNVQSVAGKRAALKKEIAATREELAQLSEGMTDAAARWLTQETALLERLDAVYAEQQRTLQHAADLAKEAADVEERTRNQRPPEATLKPPLGMELFDQLYDERDYLEQAGGWLKTDITNTETMLQEARDTLEEKERVRRTVRETVDTGDAKMKAPGNLRLAELEVRLAQETVVLQENALRTLKLQESLLGPKQKLLRPRFEWLRAHLALGDGELAASKQAREERGGVLDDAIASAKEEADAAARLVIAAERHSKSDQASEELESRRADRQTANLTLSVLTSQRARLAERADVAALRRRVLGGELSSKEMRAAADENQEAIDQLERERKRQAMDLLKSRKELQEGQGRLTRAAAGDEKAALWTLERMKRLSGWIDLSESELADLDRLHTERNRLKEELSGRVNLFSVRDTLAICRENVIGAWNYEIFSVNDAPIRVKTMLGVLLLVVAGYYGSRWASALMSRTVFTRMGMNTGRKAAWQTLWFYGLFILVLVVAFDFFHISLTQFSVMSGALAVGLGFGSQNLISNFISGIILLVERPVNQGDVIEIDGRQVTVEQLGPRSTIVRTADNTHLVVPNSRLLEQPVINWTLSDDVVRKRIRLGVAYDSSSRKVSELLEGVLGTVENVRKDPAPVVKFADFGENSLIFELYFWVSISDPVDAENELRHRIAEVFAKEGVVMAFPQRDVHLETTKPLEVMITQAASRANDAGPAMS